MKFLKLKTSNEMKFLILFLLFFFIISQSHAQITNGYWMFGGNLSASINKTGSDDQGSKSTDISMSADAGYFFADKFAGGIVLSYNLNNLNFLNGSSTNNFSNSESFYGGPFIRYYLLPSDNLYNIIANMTFQLGEMKDRDMYKSHSAGSNKFVISAGPVIFFNNNAGLEFLLNYTSISTFSTNLDEPFHSFGFSIGFQIHVNKQDD